MTLFLSTPLPLIVDKSPGARKTARRTITVA
jgi:hypothetical protein